MLGFQMSALMLMRPSRCGQEAGRLLIDHLWTPAVKGGLGNNLFESEKRWNKKSLN